MAFDMDPFDSKRFGRCQETLSDPQDRRHGSSGAEKDQKVIFGSGCRYSDYL